MNNITSYIVKGIYGVITQEDVFRNWAKHNNPSDGDYVVINNSFIFRHKIKTTKSPQYLFVEWSKNTERDLENRVFCCSNYNMNSDFKVISKTEQCISDLIPLDEAVSSELSSLGFVVFILIGQIHDTQPNKVSLKKNQRFEAVRRDPQASLDVQIDGSTIILQKVIDIDSLCSKLEQQGEVISDEDRTALASTLDQLAESTEFLLTLPNPSLVTQEKTLLAHLLEPLIQDIESYENSLKQINSPGEYNNILRISYNFATEALDLIRLIVSLCDLKPVVLWCTLGEHIALQSAMSSLPWGRLGRKASLEHYNSLVKDARNQAFHHTFTLNQRIRVDLSERSLEAQWLTMFSPHSKKGENKFVYEDKELIELLTGFTSSPKRILPLSFWTGNLDVLKATRDLLIGTRDALVLLAKESSHLM